MLAYLDALLAALAARDTAEAERLLAHPLSRILTSEALLEAQTAAAPSGVPMRLLQLRHQTAQLLPGQAGSPDGDATRRFVSPHAARRAPARHQMELPLPV